MRRMSVKALAMALVVVGAGAGPVHAATGDTPDPGPALGHWTAVKLAEAVSVQLPVRRAR